jgi:hypothetical protein
MNFRVIFSLIFLAGCSAFPKTLPPDTHCVELLNIARPHGWIEIHDIEKTDPPNSLVVSKDWLENSRHIFYNEDFDSYIGIFYECSQGDSKVEFERIKHTVENILIDKSNELKKDGFIFRYSIPQKLSDKIKDGETTISWSGEISPNAYINYVHNDMYGTGIPNRHLFSVVSKFKDEYVYAQIILIEFYKNRSSKNRLETEKPYQDYIQIIESLKVQ